MKICVFIFITFISLAAFAEKFQDRIHSVELSTTQENHLILLENGRVVQLKYDDPRIEDYKTGDSIEVAVNSSNEVLNISSNIDSTILPNYDVAKTIFNGMNRSWKSNTECTDRAHVWVYEEWKKYGLVSNKVFLFFTNTYIRRYNFGWWFHVSPYTLVGSAQTEYVMDRRYSSTPKTMKSWTDIFIRSKRSCPVTSYRHYRNNKNGVEHCFAVKSNMYNRLPYHVRMEEDYGNVQTRFNTSEVNSAYRAFTRRGVK